ncbi:hypothetical protein [Kutzneria buriramensis]|uniref:Uncharacterized protein n=1 Tax=Kutzneria buriramensis TaxID=1045776 RepID=A0A3E0GWD4_9PSEU|nr:hypothetical protein [Kutzneria buriramensis]REH28646.1 hypothetical protein BCF44_12688 [Kutzneria buriramensis]
MIPVESHPWFLAHPVSCAHILWHWQQATRSDTARGWRWYAEAHAVAVSIADGDATLGSGVLAVYSPQQAWSVNVLTAARVLRDRRAVGGPGTGAFASATQRVAAERLLAGEHYDTVLTGPKIRSFAHLIEHGGDAPGTARVVVDRHALSVACGRSLTAAEYGAAPLRGTRRVDGSLTHRHYDYVTALYERAAAVISAEDGRPVRPYQVQAVTWLVRQRLNQRAEQQRGPTRLDRGRAHARRNGERAWSDFRAHHLPELATFPGTGYTAA